MKNIPVYIFTGFFEAGKTSFIKSTIPPTGFGGGGALLLRCEEGFEEFDEEGLEAKNVRLEPVDSLDQLNPEHLEALLGTRTSVIIEYNGMWELSELYAALPDNWVTAREMSIWDAETFLSLNSNMRNLVYDKLKGCSAVLFRNCQNADREVFHKVVRGCTRRAAIGYVLENGDTEPDEIEDPLPYDIMAEVVEIEDEYFADFFRDLSEEPDCYDGKAVRFKGFTQRGHYLKRGRFDFGRDLMLCCPADISFACFPAVFPESFPEPGEWVVVTAKISLVGKNSDPALGIISWCNAEKPEREVATFF